MTTGWRGHHPVLARRDPGRLVEGEVLILHYVMPPTAVESRER
jgi:hypothetical protein